MSPHETRPDLVTGATGLLGSHLCETLIHQGRRVRALVRPTSRTDFLEDLGVERVVGDLTDPRSCLEAVHGVATIYHSAAKVGDWGPWRDFQVDGVEATGRLARAALEADVDRFVHISSTSAYGHPPAKSGPIDESAPLGQNLWRFWDYYTRSKVECERLLWNLHKAHNLPLTVIRPSWLFGERDRTTSSRLIGKLRQAGVPLVGWGDNPISAVYAGLVAEAAILAAHHPEGLGEAFNITDQGTITQRTFLNLFAEAADAPKVWLPIPYALVFAAAFGFEAIGRLLRFREPPLMTRYATWLMGRHLSYSTAKARTRLGWSPDLSYRTCIERTVRWHLDADADAPSRQSTDSKAVSTPSSA